MFLAFTNLDVWNYYIANEDNEDDNEREVRPGESVSLERSGEQRRNEDEEADEEEGILEYDSSSSEDLDDESFSSNNDEADDDVGGIPSLGREATFLLGTVSRFGRTVRFNSRIIV